MIQCSTPAPSYSCAAAFPSSLYHLHYARLVPFTAMSEWLVSDHQASSTWASLPLLTEEEVQRRLRRLGVGWVQTPAEAGEGAVGW